MYSTFDKLGEKPEEHRDLYNVLELQDMNHKNSILASNALVVIDIFATWCGVCMKIAPEYSMIAEKYNIPGKIAIIKEQYEKNLTTPRPGALPVYQFFYMGQKVGQDVVGGNLEEVEKRIQEYVNSMNSNGMNSNGMNRPYQQGSGNSNQNVYHNRSSIRNSKMGPSNPIVNNQEQFRGPQQGQQRQRSQPQNSSGPMYYTQN